MMFVRDLRKKIREIIYENRKIRNFFQLDSIQELKFLKILGQRVGIESEGWGVGFQSSKILDFKNFNSPVTGPFCPPNGQLGPGS